MYHLRRHLQLIKSNHKPLLHVTLHEFESRLHYSRELNLFFTAHTGCIIVLNQVQPLPLLIIYLSGK